MQQIIRFSLQEEAKLAKAIERSVAFIDYQADYLIISWFIASSSVQFAENIDIHRIKSVPLSPLKNRTKRWADQGIM